MAAEEGGDVRAADKLQIQRTRPGQHHHEAPEPLPLTRGRQEGEPAEVDLRLLAGLRLEAHGRPHGPPESEGLE
jgi:hypothetical protein